MTKYDFDTYIERRGTSSMKWDLMGERFGDSDLLPYWVADMDFKSPPEVIEAIEDKLKHGVLGYPVVKDSLVDSIVNWEKKRHGWSFDKSAVTWSPGVVGGLAFAIEAYTKPGDGIILQTPVYPPFYEIIETSGRHVVKNPLKRENGKFVMDLEGLEKLITPTCRTLIFCSPHNPVSRVWTKTELEKLAELAARKNMLILSDEIHQDIVFSDAKHTCLATLPGMEKQTLTYIAPSKTFNLAGLSSSIVIIPDHSLMEQYKSVLVRFHLSRLNGMGLVAMEAAYSKCAQWADEMVEYIEGNRDFTEKFVKERMPKAKMDHPEGTYIFWIDFRGYGFDGETLPEFLVREAKVALNKGLDFGEEGAGFARINVGTTRKQLAEGLERIAKALDKRETN
ncbi:MAG: pyridoxal phosphate-dependent aminotransferase [Synergistaceae bacterium]|nr:pyridoxal phosphate-dependent aminotransferase [Synergistaceae bacterium]